MDWNNLPRWTRETVYNTHHHPNSAINTRQFLRSKKSHQSDRRGTVSFPGIIHVGSVPFSLLLHLVRYRSHRGKLHVTAGIFPALFIPMLETIGISGSIAFVYENASCKKCSDYQDPPDLKYGKCDNAGNVSQPK